MDCPSTSRSSARSVCAAFAWTDSAVPAASIDQRFPLADQLVTLVELQEAGKIAHIGISEVTVAQLREAQRFATITTVQTSTT